MTASRLEGRLSLGIGWQSHFITWRAARYYLACRAAEMLLKCALLKRNVLPAELKKQHVRHRLGELLELVQKKGVATSERSVQGIVSLDRRHKDHALRYLFLMEESEPVFTLPAQDVFSPLDG